MGVYSKIKRLLIARTNQADKLSLHGVTILKRDYVPKDEMWIINESGFRKKKLTKLTDMKPSDKDVK